VLVAVSRRAVALLDKDFLEYLPFAFGAYSFRKLARFAVVDPEEL